MNNIKIEMLSTGDEVLYGQVVDSNAAWLSDTLFDEGFLITSRTTVGDDLSQLVDALTSLSLKNTILIVNGGLGPTIDDLSAQAAAIANNEPLVLNQQWLMEMEKYYSARGKSMPSKNKKQAMLPKSASIINNPVGTACGFKLNLNDCIIYFTPGVPSEFKQMVKNEILPDLKQYYPAVNPPICYRLTTMGRAESELATVIESQLTLPEGIALGYRAAMPIVELKLTGRSNQKAQMARVWDQLKALVSDNLLYEGKFESQNGTGLAGVVSQLLKQRSLSIAILEQSTTGMIAQQLFESGAPVVKSEVVPSVLGDMAAYTQLLRDNTQADIALGLLSVQGHGNLFTLVIITPKQREIIHLNYTGRLYGRETQNQIMTAIALDAVRRYLLELPLVGPNIWLETMESLPPR